VFTPGLISLIVSMALTAAPDLLTAEAAKQTQQTSAAHVAAAPATARRVMTWVPPYATTESRSALKQMHGGVGPGNALTHLALQFWWPKPDGAGLQYSTDGEVDDQTVHTFVTWAHAHNIKVLLCVYNAVPDWNWPRAKKAFADNRVKLAAALAAEVTRLGLDGVDIDFEGDDVNTTGEFNRDKGAYVAFIRTLRAKLGAKQLTVAVMGCIVNGPGESKHADIGISLPGPGEQPTAPVFIEGKKVATLRGPTLTADFKQLVTNYIERRFGQGSGQGIGTAAE
jgi:hypothetical protein